MQCYVVLKEMGSLYVACECGCLHCSWMVKCFFVRKLKGRQEVVKDFFQEGERERFSNYASYW